VLTHLPAFLFALKEEVNKKTMPPLSKIYGYEIRNPQREELRYFKKNPNVSGMAAEDNRIILNPYSGLSDEQMNAVARNEATRLYLREEEVVPDFKLTDEQTKKFKEYSSDLTDIKHTILGRILTNDPSVGEITPEQKNWAKWLKTQLEKRSSK